MLSSLDFHIVVFVWVLWLYQTSPINMDPEKSSAASKRLHVTQKEFRATKPIWLTQRSIITKNDCWSNYVYFEPADFFTSSEDL